MRIPSKLLYKNTAYFLILPAIATLLFVIISPMIYSIFVSLHTWYLAKPKVRPFIGLKNYYFFLFQDPIFRVALRNTVSLLGVCIPVEFGLGLLLASLLNRKNLKARRFFRSCLILPLAVTPIVVGVLWKFILHPRYGVLNYFLSLLGLPSIEWIADPRFALISVMMVDIWAWTPFMVLVLYAGLVSLPQAPLEAAKIDGASGWQEFIHIAIPLVTPIITVAILIRVMDIMKMFDIVYVLTRGGPGDATELLSLYNFRIGLNYFYIGRAAALSWLIAIMVIVIAQVFLKITKTA